jgi:hypothetical protein
VFEVVSVEVVEDEFEGVRGGANEVELVVLFVEDEKIPVTVLFNRSVKEDSFSAAN